MREKNRKLAEAGPKPERAFIERTCIGCMKRDSKSAMIRIAVVNGKVEADFAARCPGRGGYLHATNECADKFVASKVKEFRALRRKIDRTERLIIAMAIKQRLDRNAKVE
jgi:predicted RNA-binding protein YlxR (DUF448 family)